MKHAQYISKPKAESNRIANPSHHSFESPAENYQACFGLFIPLNIKKWELLL